MAIEMAFACKMAHFASRMRVAAHVRVCARVAHVCAHTPQAQRILVKTRSCVRASRVAHYARGKFPQFATFSLTGGCAIGMTARYWSGSADREPRNGKPAKKIQVLRRSCR